MELILPWPALLAALAAVLAGALVQGTMGFGLTLVAGPFLAMVEPRLMPGPLLLDILLLSALAWRRERHQVHLGQVSWALLGRLPGTALGVVALALIPREETALMMGAMVVVAVLFSLSGLHLRPSRGHLLAAGAVSGFMGTTAALGGPAMALVYQHASAPTLRGTLSAYFTIAAVLSLGALALVGRFGAYELTAGALLAPAMAGGFLLSTPLSRHLPTRLVRPLVLALAGLSGLAAIVKSLLI